MVRPVWARFLHEGLVALVHPELHLLGTRGSGPRQTRTGKTQFKDRHVRNARAKQADFTGCRPRSHRIQTAFVAQITDRLCRTCYRLLMSYGSQNTLFARVTDHGFRTGYTPWLHGLETTLARVTDHSCTGYRPRPRAHGLQRPRSVTQHATAPLGTPQCDANRRPIPTLSACRAGHHSVNQCTN